MVGVFFLNNFYFSIIIVMIYINKGEVNTIVLTLSEDTTISNPYYLFVFQNEYNLESDKIYWIGTDTSAYKNRYNLFTLEEGEDATFVKGQYVYKVYESEVPPEDETGLTLVEEGRMVVAGEDINSIYD
jgi:hypothetical protein